jgi:hypothetical protein
MSQKEDQVGKGRDISAESRVWVWYHLASPRFSGLERSSRVLRVPRSVGFSGLTGPKVLTLRMGRGVLSGFTPFDADRLTNAPMWGWSRFAQQRLFLRPRESRRLSAPTRERGAAVPQRSARPHPHPQNWPLRGGLSEWVPRGTKATVKLGSAECESVSAVHRKMRPQSQKTYDLRCRSLSFLVVALRGAVAGHPAGVGAGCPKGPTPGRSWAIGSPSCKNGAFPDLAWRKNLQREGGGR